MASLVAVFVVFLILGAVGVGVLLANRKKPDERPPAKAEGPHPELTRPPAVTKADPPPARELEAVEKFLPDDTSLAAVFDVKQLQASPAAKKVLLVPIAEELAPLRAEFGLDLPALVERAVVGVRSEDRGGALVVLQGRALVTPRLTDALRTLAGRTGGGAWDGTSDVYAVGAGPTFLATSETALLLSSRRDLIAEALEKRDGARRTTRFADPTVGAGLEALNRPILQLTAFGRSSSIQVVVGVRQRWLWFQPSARQLNFLIGLVVFDDRGMHLHAVADEVEAGKAAEFLRSLGKVFGDLGRAAKPPEQRLERIEALLTSAEPAVKGPSPKRPYAHLVASVPARHLDEWFAPFLPTKSD